MLTNKKCYISEPGILLDSSSSHIGLTDNLYRLLHVNIPGYLSPYSNPKVANKLDYALFMFSR